MILNKFKKLGLIDPPKWLPSNTLYLTLSGSITYGCSTDASDKDIVGVCIPPKKYVFPSSDNLIMGFDELPKFNVWQKHHVVKDLKNYDFSVYSIIKFFYLATQNNPNIIDSLFTRTEHHIHVSQSWRKVLDKRKIFLHAGAYNKFRGYSYSQLHKMKSKKPDPTSKRYESVKKHGYDIKFAYHIVRLLDECKQILTTGDIDLMQDRERLKSIRRGEWTMDKIINHFEREEENLSKLYTKTKLPLYPDKVAIKNLLLSVLEDHYGDLNKIIPVTDSDVLLQQIKDIISV